MAAGVQVIKELKEEQEFTWFAHNKWQNMLNLNSKLKRTITLPSAGKYNALRAPQTGICLTHSVGSKTTVESGSQAFNTDLCDSRVMCAVATLHFDNHDIILSLPA